MSSVVIKVLPGGMDGVPSAIEKAILTALTGVGAVLTGKKLRLFQNDFAPTKSSVVADFTEATFDGYAESAAIVWGDPMVDANGNAVIQGGAVEFRSTGDTTPNTIYGCYLTDDPATEVDDFYRFTTPVEVSVPDTGIVIVPVFSFSPPVLIAE